MIRKNALALRDLRPLLIGGTALLFAAAALFAVSSRAQEAAEIVTVDPAVDPILSPAELEDLVAPVALYPDDVLAIILPASTFPLQIVQASRFLDEFEVDSSLQPDEDWDDSIIALLNYPEVVRMMNEDLDWTWALGEAVLTDQSAVLAAAQDFRRIAYAAGNLETDDRQIVTQTADTIVIEPADPEVVYIPYYDPREVVVYQSRPVYYYYPVAYPLYYYPYPVGYRFSTGFFFGVTSWFALGWDSHYVHVHHHSHYLHPYYLDTHYTYRPYYYRNDVHVTVNVNNYSDVWQPSPRRGARPRTATVSGRTSTVRTQRTATVETQPGPVTQQSATQRATGTVNTKLTTSARESARRTATGQTSTSTRAVQTGESRRSTVGQGDRASASNRSSGSTAPPSAQPTDIVRPSDLAGSAAVRARTTPLPQSSVRSSGVSQSQIRSVPTSPGSAAVTTTPRQSTPNRGASTRSTTGNSTATTTTSMTPRATTVTPRTMPAPRTTTSQSSVRTPSAPPPRSSVAVQQSSPVSTPRSNSNSSSNFSAPASVTPRAPAQSSVGSRSSSSSSSSSTRRR